MFFWREHEKFLNKKKLYEKEGFSYAWRIESDQKGFLKKKKKGLSGITKRLEKEWADQVLSSWERVT